MTEKLPPDISEDETIKSLTFKVDDFLQSPSRKNSRSRQSRSEESDNESCVGEETKEVVEQFEPGVYVTLVEFPNGTRKFKRVKFRYISITCSP